MEYKTNMEGVRVTCLVVEVVGLITVDDGDCEDGGLRRVRGLINLCQPFLLREHRRHVVDVTHHYRHCSCPYNTVLK